jgi:RNA polymerase sigma-70 factor, ECF subfamily
MQRYSKLVSGLVANKVPMGNIEEVLQEVFVQAFKSLDKYKAQAPFKHWLSVIAVRCCHNFWRENYRRPEAHFSLISDEHERWLEDLLAGQSEEDFKMQTQKSEAKEFLNWILEHLTPDDRMALSLVHLENYSVKEAAALLNWSESKVKVRMHRARLEMRTLLHNLIAQKKVAGL